MWHRHGCGVAGRPHYAVTARGRTSREAMDLLVESLTRRPARHLDPHRPVEPAHIPHPARRSRRPLHNRVLAARGGLCHRRGRAILHRAGGQPHTTAPARPGPARAGSFHHEAQAYRRATRRTRTRSRDPRRARLAVTQALGFSDASSVDLAGSPGDMPSATTSVVTDPRHVSLKTSAITGVGDASPGPGALAAAGDVSLTAEVGASLPAGLRWSDRADGSPAGCSPIAARKGSWPPGESGAVNASHGVKARRGWHLIPARCDRRGLG